MQAKPSFSRLITASSLGTILEWYDFSLFAFFTPVFAHLFFPHENRLTSLMLTYVIFAVGFLVRPLGAVLFGHLGDRIGRSHTLVLTILLMSFSTFCMGLLPTYYQIGLWAPLLLILLRLCQGLSAGGESTGAVLCVLESIPQKNRGFISATVWAMTGIGMLLGSAVGSLAMQFSEVQYAWRFPFLLGIVTGIVGYFVRRRIPESTLFTAAQHNDTLHRFPLLNVIKDYRRELLITIGMYILSAMITYLIFVFMPTYAAQVIGMPLSTISLISTGGLLLVTLLVPFGGFLSDKWGRKTSLCIGALGFLFLSYPLFELISYGIISYYIIALSCFVLLAANFQGALPPAVFEMLPLSVRYSVAAIGYNISYSIFGGTAPLLASYLVKVTGDKAAPGYYLVFGALIALIAASQLRLKESRFFVMTGKS